MMLDDWCFVPVSQESQGFPFSRESNRGDKKALCIALHLMSRFSGLQSPLPYMQRLDRLEKITAELSGIRIRIIQVMPSLALGPSFNDCPHE